MVLGLINRMYSMRCCALISIRQVRKAYFANSYWDLEVSRENNSYVNAAIAQGYSTFFYDRLGNGKSSKPDPNTIVQSYTELAILAELTKLVRGNKLNLSVGTPTKVIHVGHSYGSVLSNYIASTYPELSDGVILTGFSHNLEYEVAALVTWGFQIARIQSPRKFGDFVSQYFTWASKWSGQLFFFKYPYFTSEILDYAESNKQPVGLGTLLSLASGNFYAADFKGPVLVGYPFYLCMRILLTVVLADYHWPVRSCVLWRELHRDLGAQCATVPFV